MIRVNVTQEHIDNAWQMSVSNSPINLAIIDAWTEKPKDTDIFVGSYFVSYVRKGVRTTVGLPTEAQDFLTAFDARKPVHPFSFNLEVPSA